MSITPLAAGAVAPPQVAAVGTGAAEAGATGFAALVAALIAAPAGSTAPAELAASADQADPADHGAPTGLEAGLPSDPDDDAGCAPATAGIVAGLVATLVPRAAQPDLVRPRPSATASVGPVAAAEGSPPAAVPSTTSSVTPPAAATPTPAPTAIPTAIPTATPTATPTAAETAGLPVQAPAHPDFPGARGDLSPAGPAGPAAPAAPADPTAPVGPLDPASAASTADPAAPAAVTTPDGLPTATAAPAITPASSAPAPVPATHAPQVAAAARHVVEEVARLAEAAGAGSRVARQVVLRLDPGALGEVHVRLRVIAGVVRVHLSAGDAAVRDRLAGDLGLLHDLLGTRADDVRVVVQDLPRGSGREATTAPATAGEHPVGDAGDPTPGSSDDRRPGQQPGDAPPEHGRPTWMSAVTHATDGTHAEVRGPTPADLRTTSPAGLDVSV